MESDFDLQRITAPLLEWYVRHARVLPWRECVTPYRIWVSEIMLQQTRADAVKPYFERFIDALPTVQSLAACGEDRLLKLWEGLGYYSRARNMRETAKELMTSRNGQLPADYEGLLSLKGIGPYTAGAIASIAYGIPVPAVDGNVLRVIMRVTGDSSDIAKQSVRLRTEKALKEILPADHAGEFNQALMELGATVCLPNGNPLCDKCPWAFFCRAKQQGTYRELPVKKRAKSRRREARTILVIRDGTKVMLRKRPSTGLLAGLYEFPNVDGHLSRSEVPAIIRGMGLRPLHIKKLREAIHVFSHVEWHMTGYMIQVDSPTGEGIGLLFFDSQSIRESFPIPSAFAAYIAYI